VRCVAILELGRKPAALHLPCGHVAKTWDSNPVFVLRPAREEVEPAVRSRNSGRELCRCVLILGHPLLWFLRRQVRP
jgi:hypothetical protein